MAIAECSAYSSLYIYTGGLVCILAYELAATWRCPNCIQRTRVNICAIGDSTINAFVIFLLFIITDRNKQNTH